MHHTRHIVIVSVSLAFLAFAFSARVQAAPEDRVQKLEEKVNSIEESQQQILQLLKDLNGGKPAPAPSADPDPTQDAGFLRESHAGRDPGCLVSAFGCGHEDDYCIGNAARENFGQGAIL